MISSTCTHLLLQSSPSSLVTKTQQRKMAKNNKSKRNKNNNVAEAPPANPTPDSPPPPVSPKRAIADQRLYEKMEDEAFAIAATVSSFLHLPFLDYSFSRFCVSRCLELFLNQAFKTYDSDARIADEIKKEFDSRYGGTWHCIVGSNYGNN